MSDAYNETPSLTCKRGPMQANLHITFVDKGDKLRCDLPQGGPHHMVAWMSSESSAVTCPPPASPLKQLGACQLRNATR
eukprot:3587726-Amphidinium_carterae.1